MVWTADSTIVTADSLIYTADGGIPINPPIPGIVLQVINTGSQDMDATGDFLEVGYTKANQNFAILYSITGGIPQFVNTSYAPNTSLGDTAYVAFSKMNSNFSFLFAAASAPQAQSVINVGTQPYNGVIGVGDPGIVAWIKVNNNFSILGSILI